MRPRPLSAGDWWGAWRRPGALDHCEGAGLGGEGAGGQGARERGRRGMREASYSGDRRVDRAGNLGNQQG